jgi:hypothetical protein
MADFSDGKLFVKASGLPGPAAVNAALAIAAMARAAASAGSSASGVARAAELAAWALAEVCPGGTASSETSSTAGSVGPESDVVLSPAPSSSNEDSGCLDLPELARAWAARGIGHAFGPLRGPAAFTVDKLGPIGVASQLALSTNAACTSPPGVRAPASTVRPCPAHGTAAIAPLRPFAPGPGPLCGPLLGPRGPNGTARCDDSLVRVAIAGEVSPPVAALIQAPALAGRSGFEVMQQARLTTMSGEAPPAIIDPVVAALWCPTPLGPDPLPSGPLLGLQGPIGNLPFGVVVVDRPCVVSVDRCSLVCSRVRRSCSLDDFLWMDYASGTASATTRSDGSSQIHSCEPLDLAAGAESSSDVADPALCGGSPALAAAVELSIPDVPTAATALAVRPDPVDVQQAHLTMAKLSVGGAFSPEPGDVPGSVFGVVQGIPAAAASYQAIVALEAHDAESSFDVPIWRRRPHSCPGRHSSVGIALSVFDTGSDGSSRNSSQEPLAAAVDGLASEPVVIADRSESSSAVAEPADDLSFFDVPTVAPALFERPGHEDTRQAHPPIPTGDSSISRSDVSSRSHIGEPEAAVAPSGTWAPSGAALQGHSISLTEALKALQNASALLDLARASADLCDGSRFLGPVGTWDGLLAGAEAARKSARVVVDGLLPPRSFPGIAGCPAVFPLHNAPSA